MLDPKTSRFWQAAIQSGLLDAEALASCWEAVRPEKRDDPEHIDRRLGRQAVLTERLTLWQAQQLLAGRITGYQVDRYVLQELIGQGGMGRVYRARDTRLDRQVALKILSPERMNNPRAIARFQREARVGAQLQHENLVRLYDFGESQGRHFLVMEFIEGRTLGYHVATQGRIPPARAARFARQVALGLDHAHGKGLIHRDVNPFNVIVTHEGVAKLADMGLAMDLADEGKVTRDGATVGTFDYVAPEQARHSHSADIRSDIYSLGCSLYHLIAGQVPFPHPGLAEKLFAHQSQEAPPLEDLAPDLPPGLAEVVRKMMRKKPEERYQTPQEVAAALYPFMEKDPSERRAATAVGSAKTTAGGGGAALADPLVAGSSTGGGEAGSDASAEFSIKVDLGPSSLVGPPRTNRYWFGSSGSKPSSASDASSSGTSPSQSGSSANPEGVSAGRRRWLAAGLVLGLLAVGSLAEGFRRISTRGVGAPSSTSGGEPGQGKSGKPSRRTPSFDWGDHTVAIRSPDGHMRTVPDLLRGMEAALGGKGIVVLKGGTPIEFKAGQGLSLSGRGTLQIQGDDAASSLLKVDLDGGSPFLSTGSGVNLVLKGLTIEARRATPPSGSAPPPTPPLIVAAGKADVERCAFRTTPVEGFAGSRAIQSAGSSLTVDRCWFEGFDAAVEIRAMAGAEHSLRRSMFVPGGTPAAAAEAGRSVRRGWAAQVVFEGGGARDGSRSVVLEHCTIAGEGMLQIDGFSDRSPIRLDVSSCVVKAGRLLDWKPSPPDSPWTPRALAWTGVQNQLEIDGEAWLNGPGVPAVSGLEAWQQQYVEREPIRLGARFSMAPETADGRLTPAAYTLVNAPSPAPGASPGDVGPPP